MGKPKVTTVETSQKQELDPIAQAYFWSGQLPGAKLASMRRINEGVYGYEPGTLNQGNGITRLNPNAANLFTKVGGMFGERAAVETLGQPDSGAFYINGVPYYKGVFSDMGATRGGGGGDNEFGGYSGSGSGGSGGGLPGGYTSVGDMFDGGGPGASGGSFQGGGRASDIANAVTGQGPEAQKNNKANGGIVALANGGMVPPMMGGRMPNLSNQDMAYQMAMQAMRPRPYAMGGYVEGPGSGTSDSIPAKIYQDGQPVQEAALSDGEFVMTERAVRGAGNGDPSAGAARMYEMMRKFERGGRVG